MKIINSIQVTVEGLIFNLPSVAAVLPVVTGPGQFHEDKQSNEDYGGDYAYIEPHITVEGALIVGHGTYRTHYRCGEGGKANTSRPHLRGYADEERIFS